jgi:hypothetical protein
MMTMAEPFARVSPSHSLLRLEEKYSSQLDAQNATSF